MLCVFRVIFEIRIGGIRLSSNVLEKIVESNRLPVLFIGSGISKRYLYRYPNWEQLLRNSFKAVDSEAFLYEKYADELKRKAYTDFEKNAYLGTYAEEEFNKAFYDKKIKLKGMKSDRIPKWAERGTSPYKMYLSQYFKNMKLFRNDDLAKELIKFRNLKHKIAAVITTNYDQFLEKEVFSSDYSVFVNQSELFSADSYNVAEIYKIHGCVSNAESIVITKKDYDEFESSRKLIIAKMLTLFAESPLIFMGYSFTDKDVQKIISDFIGCLSPEQLKHIDEHFVFITHQKGQTGLVQTQTNILSADGKYIPITEIKTDNYELVFDILNRITPGISPLRVRQTKRVLKKIVDEGIASSNAESIIVGLDKLDDMDLSGKPLAIAVGYKENVLNKYGYGMLDAINIFEDILFNNRGFDAEQMCFERYRSIPKNHLLPVFKYVKQIKEKGMEVSEGTRLATYISDHDSLEKIIPRNIEKTLMSIPEIDDANQLIEEIEKVDSVNKRAGVLLKNIRAFEPTDIRRWLQEMFTNFPDELMQSTNFKRCVMCLDLMENHL